MAYLEGGFRRSYAKPETRKQEKVKIEKFFQARFCVEVGILHRRAFDDFCSGLYKQCEGGCTVTTNHALPHEAGKGMVMGNTYAIEIRGKTKAEVARTLENVKKAWDAFVEKEKRNPTYPYDSV